MAVSARKLPAAGRSVPDGPAQLVAVAGVCHHRRAVPRNRRLRALAAGLAETGAAGRGGVRHPRTPSVGDCHLERADADPRRSGAAPLAQAPLNEQQISGKVCATPAPSQKNMSMRVSPSTCTYKFTSHVIGFVQAEASAPDDSKL